MRALRDYPYHRLESLHHVHLLFVKRNIIYQLHRGQVRGETMIVAREDLADECTLQD